MVKVKCVDLEIAYCFEDLAVFTATQNDAVTQFQIKNPTFEVLDVQLVQLLLPSMISRFVVNIVYREPAVTPGQATAEQV